MTKDAWDDYKRESKKWYPIQISRELLHSEAYAKLDYGPAIKLLCFLHEKLRYEKIIGKKGKDRWQIRDNGHFSFPYTEANHRGLSDVQFRKALLKLHGCGFLDVVQAGSALKGDFTIYTLSDRWKKFDEANFEKKDFPKSGYRIKVGFQPGHPLFRRKN